MYFSILSSGSNSESKSVVGSKVLMKNRKNDHRMGGTLEKNWIGPYEIIEVFSKGTMKLKNCLTEKILKTVQHASNLKPYLESEQQGETRNVTEYDTEKAAVTGQLFIFIKNECVYSEY
jgi:hypothetical protein